MSHANVEIVKATNAALNRGDLDAAMESFAPDVELEDLANGPDQASVVKGAAAMREVWSLWVAAFDDLRADVEEYIDVGDDVICATHWMGHGKTSGISVDAISSTSTSFAMERSFERPWATSRRTKQ